LTTNFIVSNIWVGLKQQKEVQVKKTLLLQAILCLFVFLSNSSLNAQWARTYGGSDSDHVRSIQQTSDGGYIVAGGTESFGAGDVDIWVLKLTSIGTVDWQHTYGGSDGDWDNSIQQTIDGGYIVAGNTYSFGAGDVDIWVLKLTSTGAINWQHTYGGSGSDKVDSIQQTNDGGYIVAGYTASFGAGGGDIWVLKLTSTGTVDWQHTYGGIDGDWANSIQQTSDGGYIVAGNTDSFGAGDGDIWVLKLTSTGAINWQHMYEHPYGGSSGDRAYSIQQTSDGGYIVAGSTEYFFPLEEDQWNRDIWVLKLTSTGAIDWQQTYGAGNDDRARSIQQTNDGGYIVAGSGAGSDILVLKLSSTGAIEWQQTYGRRHGDEARSIQQTNDGGYIVAGNTFSFNAFGYGHYDFWVLKLLSDGDIDPSCGFKGTSNASVLSTSVYPEDTFITPEDTYVTPLVTNVSPQDTNASVILLCEASQDDGDGGDEDGGGGFCFIATATYGSPFHPYVETLRDFRDKYLMSNKLGRKFVDLYYKYSPFIADLIARNKRLRIIVRIQLVPIIVLSYSMVHLGPVITGGMFLCILVLPIFLISFLYRDMRRGS
jgi:uncharacterized delta-60 repeat protein